MWLLDSRSLSLSRADRDGTVRQALERAFDLECWRWSRRPDQPSAWTLVYEGEYGELACSVALDGADAVLAAAASLRLAPPPALLAAFERDAAGIGFSWDAGLHLLSSRLRVPAETGTLLGHLHRCARALDLALPAVREAAGRPPLRLAPVSVFVRS